MMTTLMTRFAPALLFSVAAGIPAIAQDEIDLDVFVGRPLSGTQTAFGGIDEADTTQLPGLNVFEAIFGFNPLSNVFNGDEPGFNNPGPDSSSNALFGAGPLETTDTITVDQLDITIDGVTAELFFWDGTGTPSFAPAAPGVGLEIDDFELSTGVGFEPDGAFDNHPVFTLFGDGSAPADGIYLASIAASIDGFDPTDPLFLVIGAADPLGSFGDIEEPLEAALEFVATNIAVPEPSAAALLLTVVAGVASRRRV